MAYYYYQGGYQVVTPTIYCPTVQSPRPTRQRCDCEKRIKFKSGTYFGDVRNGKRHGQGLMRWNSGAWYNGSWKYDKMDGFGQYHWADGKVYKGELRQGEFHGQGVQTLRDGQRYEGKFANDVKHGHGVWVYANGARRRVRYERGSKVWQESSVQDFDCCVIL
jgi:hypothetical protein